MHIFLFFLFFLFCISTGAEEERASASSFQPGWGECSESYLKNMCNGKEKKKILLEKDTVSSDGKQAGVTGLSSGESKNSDQKICQDREARKCCGDPTSCLGGEALSTFNEINNIVTQVGPGLASMLQGFGKDMSNMCETMQGLAAGGASVALAASKKCKASISSCNSNCDYQIQEVECKKYNTAANTCRTEKASCRCSNPTICQAQIKSCQQQKQQKFQAEVLPIFKQVRRHEETQVSCLAQKAKAKDISKNIPQMANSAISAELCKQQARMTENKDSCEKQKGHTWRDGKCHPPEEEEKPTVAFNIHSGTNPISHSTGSLGSPTTETPTTESTEEEGTNGDGRSSGVGGGGNIQTTGNSDGIDLPDPSSPFSDNSEEESDGTAGTTGTGKGGYAGLGRGGFGGYGSRSGYYGKKRKPYSSSEKDDDLSMGGGGFSGYGGGGFGSRGSPSSQASLGLSQKKLKELEDKKGAKRATAGEAGGGAHQSIFERVTKRFQILCQNKLDCQ